MRTIILAFLMSFCLSDPANTYVIQEGRTGPAVVMFGETNISDVVFNWRRIFPSFT